MAKRRRLPTRALGAEAEIPEASVLAEWIAEHRGRTADITTFRLEMPLAHQAAAGIDIQCSGGMFYRDRILAAIEGIEDGKAVGELHVNTREIIEDAAGIVITKKGSWCTVPAPLALGIRDTYFHDESEWNDAICGAYRTILRAMRDTGVEGHVLISDTIDPAELSALGWQKAVFYVPEPDRTGLSALLEHQSAVAVSKGQLPLLFDLMDIYDIHRLILMDPDDDSIASVLRHMDPDRLVAGGYDSGCGSGYWSGLIAAAEYPV